MHRGNGRHGRIRLQAGPADRVAVHIMGTAGHRLPESRARGHRHQPLRHMSTNRRPGRRSGVSLVELLVAMTLLGIVGLSILRTFTSQARLADLQTKRLDARAVSRAPVNLFMSDVRMVETGNGVVAATSSSVTLRIPVVMGLVCGTSAAATVLSLMPVDSAVMASAALSGRADRPRRAPAW